MAAERDGEGNKGKKKKNWVSTSMAERHHHKRQTGERESRRARQREIGRIVVSALRLFGVSCFSDSAASSMEMEPQTFSKRSLLLLRPCVFAAAAAGFRPSRESV